MESNELHESLLVEPSETLLIEQDLIISNHDQFAEITQILSDFLQTSLQSEMIVLQNLMEATISALVANAQSISYLTAELANTLMESISELAFSCADVMVPLRIL